MAIENTPVTDLVDEENGIHAIHRCFVERVSSDKPDTVVSNRRQAQCSCGYKGSKRLTRTLAERDAQRHLERS